MMIPLDKYLTRHFSLKKLKKFILETSLTGGDNKYILFKEDGVMFHTYKVN